MAAQPRSEPPGSDTGARARLARAASPRGEAGAAGWTTVALWAAGACSAGAAAVHAATVRAQMDLSPLYGWLFVAMAAGQISFALAVAARPWRLVGVVGAAGNAAILVLWVVSRTLGVPAGPEKGTVLPVGFPDALTAGLEAAVVVLALVALVARRGEEKTTRAWTLIALGSVGVIVATSATLAVLVQLGVVTSIPASL